MAKKKKQTHAKKRKPSHVPASNETSREVRGAAECSTVIETGASVTAFADGDVEVEVVVPSERDVEEALAAVAEEQRASQRVAVAVDIHLASDSHFFSGLSGDISEGGLFLSTYRPLPVGSAVDLEFSLPGAPAPVHAVAFDKAIATHEWSLHELNPALPADWTGYDFLVVDSPSILGSGDANVIENAVDKVFRSRSTG